VLVDVAVRQRLLDHGQAEGVEAGEVLGVGEGVVAVGIDHQRDLGEALADGADVLDVLAALDLHLDAVVAGRHRLLDRGEQRRRRVLQADADPRHDAGARPAEHLVQGTPGAFRDQVDEGVLDRRLGHPVAADVPEAPVELAEGDPRLDERQEELGDDVPRRGGGLAGVERVGVGDALAPGGHAVGLEAQQQRLLGRPHRRRDREGGDERQPDGDQLDAVDRPDDLVFEREGGRGRGVRGGLRSAHDAQHRQRAVPRHQ
jgi:hypothetical protein